MWKKGRYQPSAKSSLLTNYHLLKFRYSHVDDIPADPDLVEGRPFALLVIQAISRHLQQLRIDFEAAIPKGKRELTCSEFVAFVAHYMKYRECETCPTFCSRHVYDAEVRRQELQSRGGGRSSELQLLMMHAQSTMRRPSSGSGTAGQRPNQLLAVSASVTPQPLTPAAELVQPNEMTGLRLSQTNSEGEQSLMETQLFSSVHVSNGNTKDQDGEDVDIALQTLSRMERLDPTLLEDQLVRLYRAIDVEDSDGVCWTEFSNFLSDAILQSTEGQGGSGGQPSGGGSGGGGATALTEDVPFELNPLVVDRTDVPIISAKGVTLGFSEASDGYEGFWMVQSQATIDVTSRSTSSSNAEGATTNFKCTFEMHSTRRPQNMCGNLFPHQRDVMRTVLDENVTQCEWIPLSGAIHACQQEMLSELMSASAGNGESGGVPSSVIAALGGGGGRSSPSAGAADSSHGKDGDGIATIGLLVYSSTDLRLRLCEYRLQTGTMNVLGAVHASESFCTMAWSTYWNRLFCCSNSGSMAVWRVNHPSVVARTAYLGGPPRSCLERTHSFHEHKSTICKIIFLPLDGSVATASLDPRLIVQDLESSTIVADLHGAKAGIRDISYNIDYHMIAACGYEPNVRLWVMHESTRSSPLILQSRNTVQHSLPIIGVHFIPHTPYLTSADSNGLVRIWDLRTLGLVQDIDLELRRYPGHPREKSIQQLSVIGDSDMMLSSRRFAFLVHPLRESTATQRRSEAETVVAMGYSFSASTVVTATASSLQMWDLRAGSINAVFATGVSTKEEEITAIALDLQGRKIVVGFRGGRVRMYSSVNGALLKLLVVSRASGVEIVDIKTMQHGMCISVDSTGNVCCFSDREEGCQFAYMEACGFQGHMPLFVACSKLFPHIAVAHAKMVITLFEVSVLPGLAPSMHSSFSLTSSSISNNAEEDESGTRTELPVTRAAARRNAVAESAVTIAQSVDIVGMDFCDGWRSLVVLDSCGELHVCQIGPTKERGLRCTHRIRIMQPSTNLSPVARAETLTLGHSSSSLMWIPSCIQYLAVGTGVHHSASATFGSNESGTPSLAASPRQRENSSVASTRFELCLYDRRGELVSLALHKFVPPHRKSRYIFEHGGLWATSVRMESSHHPASSSHGHPHHHTGTPSPTPRSEIISIANDDNNDFDWADEISVVIVRHNRGAATAIASLPKVPGVDRGPVAAVLQVPALGMTCMQPAGSRSLYVSTLDNINFVGELSLDRRAGTAAVGYLGPTIDAATVAATMEALVVPDGGCSTNLDVDVESLVVSSYAGQQSNTPFCRSGSVTARRDSVASRTEECLPQPHFDKPPPSAGTSALRRSTFFPNGGFTLERNSVSQAPTFGSKPSTAAFVLETHNKSKRSAQQHAPISMAHSTGLHANSGSQAQHPPHSTTTSLVYDAVPEHSTLVDEDDDEDDASCQKMLAGLASTPSGAKDETRHTPPSSPSCAPPIIRMKHTEVLVNKRIGLTGRFTPDHHPLQTHHKHLVEAEHLHFQLPNDQLCFHQTGRAATPMPTSFGAKISSLTTKGWRSPSVELRPASGLKRSLPPLPHSVESRCNVTEPKKKGASDNGSVVKSTSLELRVTSKPKVTVPPITAPNVVQELGYDPKRLPAYYQW